MNTKGRMTFRFDRSPTSSAVQENAPDSTGHQTVRPKVVPFRQADAFVSEIAPWNSPFQDDPAALEKVIRAADPNGRPAGPGPKTEEHYSDSVNDELLRSRSSHSRTFQAVPAAFAPPVSDVIEQDDYKGPFIDQRETGANRPGRGPSWLKVAASVSGAVITGALFGYLVLSLFAGQPPVPGLIGTPKSPAALPAQADKSADEAAATSEISGAAGAATTRIKLPERSYYLLQYGVFNGKEGMNAAVQELKSRGFAATADNSDGYRVFAGIALNKKDAQTLSGKLGDLQVFIKPTALPGELSVPAQKEPAAVRRFFEQTAELIDLLSGMTIAKLESETQTRFGSEQSAAWESLHQSWTQTAAEMRKNLDDPYKPVTEQIVKAVNTAAISLGEYDKRPSKAHLWTVQNELMEAVLGRKHWP
jgi:hypothetical protein